MLLNAITVIYTPIAAARSGCTSSNPYVVRTHKSHNRLPMQADAIEKLSCAARVLSGSEEGYNSGFFIKQKSN